MVKTGVNDLRRSYLEFFESKEHLKMNSFSLVPPASDKSLLLINAGMAPLKPYFTGAEIPPRKRVTTCQKCIRTGDIENVGKTARHLTFFEMLGNFSFGDYFKHEAIAWSWEFLTKVMELDPDRLYPSIYGEDDEAFDIWTKEIGVAPEKITRFYRDPETGECDNFWEHGAGPCGPCSEIYYDRGLKYGCGKPDCKVGCDCDRFMEIWNNVFTQFDGDGKGNYTELENKNIDTGMGLERLAVVMQDVDSVFDIDTMKAIRDKVCELSNKKYEANDKDDVSIRLITDHIRSSTFMISDGIMPSNSGRGYVLRRIIRRAARHGRMLGIDGTFMAKLAMTVINESKDGYPELEEKKDFILKVMTQEEEKFNSTIDQGLAILNDMEEKMKAEGKNVLSGEDVFRLYDTYGFPVDLTDEILQEKDFSYDLEGFEKAKEAAKKASAGTFGEHSYSGSEETVYDKIDSCITSTFNGYDHLEASSKITVITNSEEIVEALAEGDEGTIIVDETPFYATMGGQQADLGMITTEGGSFKVTDTIKLMGGKIGHVGVVVQGMVKVGDVAKLSVDAENRMKTCRNHSATHLLQKALRDVLGTHVEQAGSYQDADRTRFDFSHFQALTQEELDAVEKAVNEKIAEAIPVVTDVMTLEEAKKTGAMQLFGEKYGEVVRVVRMGDYSIEFCGGTHVSNTSLIGQFKIISETGVAAGVRRIEALTGSNVAAYYKELEEKLDAVSKALKSNPSNVLEKATHVMQENKELRSELEALKSKAAKDAMGDVAAKDVNGIKVVLTSLSGVDMNGLRELGDQLKEKNGDCVIVLASDVDGKVNLIAMASDAAVKKGAHAGNIIKEAATLVGGGGGGRPNMAQAGGKNPAGIADALAKAEAVIASQLA